MKEPIPGGQTGKVSPSTTHHGRTSSLGSRKGTRSPFGNSCRTEGTEDRPSELLLGAATGIDGTMRDPQMGESKTTSGLSNISCLSAS